MSEMVLIVFGVITVSLIFGALIFGILDGTETMSAIDKAIATMIRRRFDKR